ncbi:hypothetical protein P261_00128 [Lachnospiraceae bacterium TWA4]|nr:hypothetical protein P261_00128 [Lachnospiraceae bacterium TWA4]
MGINLVIVEVSQKQAYIFSSNKLQHNIINSAIIAYVTSSEYFKTVSPSIYCQKDNEVYCGGGHAILQFENEQIAKQFIHELTLHAKINFPELELFATKLECEEIPNAQKVFELIQMLERKKSVRRASFSQGSFGVEKMGSSDDDANPRSISICKVNGKVYSKSDKFKEFINPSYDVLDRSFYPSNYERAFELKNLGGSKDESNFVAVVHIDGNSMGKRVEELRKNHETECWDEYRKTLKRFSDCIDKDFKDAFRELCVVIDKNIKDDKLGEIELKKSKNGKSYFPIRRIITEGDDICFVAEGRIGVESARVFLELLATKKNDVDGKNYSAAAGVAIVHQKYPFYMAYELAERLCSNAKKYIATSTDEFEVANASNVSTIDWHIDFGELKDTVEDIRKMYQTIDGKHMEIRPYVVCAPKEYMEKEKIRNYSNFRQLITNFRNDEISYARGKIKNIRSYLREGEIATINYMKANLIDGLMLDCFKGIYEDIDFSKILQGEEQEKAIFVETTDGEKRSTIFDAIEMMDTFEPLK